jgi:hypothetical protein
LTFDSQQPAVRAGGRVANQRATSENFSGRERPAQTPNPVLTITTSMPGDPKIYLDSAHGFLFQYHAEFAADVEAFLSAP